MLRVYWVLIFTLFTTAKGQCPTKGMTSFVVVSVTPNSTIDDFKHMFDYYGLMAEKCGSQYTHEIHFGSQKRRTITSKEFKTFWDNTDSDSLYASSVVQDTDLEQYDVGTLTSMMEDILKSVCQF